MRKAILLFLVIPFLSCIQTEIHNSTHTQERWVKFNTFRDVPGITENEIRAIEALQKENESFIYGMPLSVEAFENKNGEIRGFSALYCEWMTQLFEIEFKPKLYSDMQTLQAGLATGEIDFTGELTENEERLKIYHMTTAIASRILKYFRISNSQPLNEITKDRLLKCGFLKGTATRNTVSAELAPGTFEIIELDNVSYVYEALKSGYIDAFYYTNTVEVNFIEYPDIIAYDFYPLTYRPVSLTTQDDKLEPVISIMEKILENGGLRYLTGMYNKGEQEYLGHKLYTQLTAEELEYIKNNPVIPYAIDSGNYPDTFFDKRENEWKGVYLEILKEVTALTGLQFERKNDNKADWPLVYNMVLTGEVAMVPELIQSADREGLFLWPDIMQITDYYALISNTDFPDIKVNEILYVRVGLAKHTAYTAVFQKWFPNHMNTIEYNSMNEAFEALQRGEVDMVMATQKRLLYLTHYLEHPNYKTNIVFDYAVNSKFGFNKDQKILCSIFNKALGLIDVKSVSDRWNRQTYDYRLKLAQAQRPLFIGLSVLLLCLFALIAVLFTRSRQAGKHLKKIVEKRTHDLEMQTTTFKTLLDSIPDLVFMMDMDLRFKQCNKNFLIHFGKSKDQVIGKDESGLNVSPKITEEHNNWNRKVIDEGKLFIFEEHIPGADGTSPFFETIKTPIILDNEKIGLLAISRDMTKRKEMEEKALAASLAKSAFLANMSHEIRTPMNSIMGFSELAIDNNDINKIKDYLGKIKLNSEWLLQIINNILDLSKIESGKMELEKIPFDMHELFTSCRTLVLPKAVEKGLTLHFYAEPSLGRVPLGDPTRLRQVFVNFLSNSVKFTNSGIVKLYSKVVNSTENTITMHFEIKDSGIGMTAEQIERIFDPFMQAESGTTRKYGGTGLGLAITKNIIEMMGGKININSTPKVGTIFSFNLTFETTDETAENTRRINIEHSDIDKPSFKGEILLCEDNPMNQEVISDHLARIGLEIVIAENGKIGVGMVRERIENGKKPFDLIFMDVHMPVMDGLEASTKILEMNTGVPIIAMTANIMSTDIEVYLKSGMKDCIGKPFTSQELWRLLLKYITPINMENRENSAEAETKKEFSQKMHYLFFRDNEKKFEEITAALEAKDIVSAHRLAHTLKSNAAQIGKTLLQQAAMNIENHLKEGFNHVAEDHLKILEAELKAVLNEIKPLAEEYTEKAAAAKLKRAPLDQEKIRKAFDELEPLLKDGNSECLDYSDILASIPEAEKLLQYMEEYELKEALDELLRIKTQLGFG